MRVGMEDVAVPSGVENLRAEGGFIGLPTATARASAIVVSVALVYEDCEETERRGAGEACCGELPVMTLVSSLAALIMDDGVAGDLFGVEATA